jgi:4-carboxymuconolactone decarboxylase
MHDQNEHLGGRLPLFAPNSLTAAQKDLYDFIMSKMVPWANSSGFKANLADGTLIGPFNPVLLSPEMCKAFLSLQQVEQENTSLSARVREIIILTVGSVWQSDYERYAHSAVAQKAGLSSDATRALGQGHRVDELSRQERLAQQVTRKLTVEHKIDDELYEEAVDALGTRGIVELVVLAGCYDIISSLLNVFRVPSPSEEH